MRITGGQLGGRRIATPRGDLRPTQDRVRESLFSVLLPRLPGARVLDLFSGSGAIGFEAVSRGAAEVWLVEQDRRALVCIRDNIRELGVDGVHVAATDVLRFLVRGAWTKPGFDVIYCDPPYEAARRRVVRGRVPGPALAQQAVEAVAAGGWLRESGVLVVEQEAREALDAPRGYETADERLYGKTRLRFITAAQKAG